MWVETDGNSREGALLHHSMAISLFDVASGSQVLGYSPMIAASSHRNVRGDASSRQWIRNSREGALLHSTAISLFNVASGSQVLGYSLMIVASSHRNV